MNQDDFYQIIIGEIAPFIADIDYHVDRRRSIFYQEFDEGRRAISFDIIKSSNATYSLDIVCQIRLTQIDDVFFKHNLLLESDRARRDHNTLSVRYGNQPIFPKGLPHSYSIGEIEILVADLKEHIEKYMIPFLTKYSRLEQLIANLQCEDYIEWITSDRMQRYPILLSYAAIKRDQEMFETYSEEFLSWAKKPYAEHHASNAESIVSGIGADFFAKA